MSRGHVLQLSELGNAFQAEAHGEAGLDLPMFFPIKALPLGGTTADRDGDGIGDNVFHAAASFKLDSGFKLIVPILARDGSLSGILGLGEKRSGLPFLNEDRDLLRAIASSAAWVIELEHTGSHTPAVGPPRPPPPGRIPELDEDETVVEPSRLAELARECPNCGRLYPGYTVLCNACSKRTAWKNPKR